MMEPTLESIFEAGATQDANTLTSLKSALDNVGLMASATNRLKRCQEAGLNCRHEDFQSYILNLRF